MQESIDDKMGALLWLACEDYARDIVGVLDEEEEDRLVASVHLDEACARRGSARRR